MNEREREKVTKEQMNEDRDERAADEKAAERFEGQQRQREERGPRVQGLDSIPCPHPELDRTRTDASDKEDGGRRRSESLLFLSHAAEAAASAGKEM